MCVVIGCKSVNLQGSRNVTPGMRKIKVTCSSSQLSTTKTQEVKGANNTKVSIEGQICLSGEITSVDGEANIVFIVDKSNSMANADPNCERKKAIQTVISATTGGESNSNIKGAIVIFGQYAKSSGWKNLTSVLSSTNVCGTGGSGGKILQPDNGGTNYEAAFNEAKSLLKGKSGTNIIYFITDGAPSVTSSSSYDGGNDWSGGQSAGRTAMNNLKDAVSDLTVNAIYLVDPKLSTYDGAPSESETYDYLVSIVGNSDNVKKASDASELVDQISNFETVPAGTFASAKDLSATVTVNGSDSSVSIAELIHESEGVYTYKLSEVSLKGTKGSVVENVFTVTGKGSNGETSTSKVIVKFTRTN